MNKYRVGIGSNCYQSLEVEADSEEAAEEVALTETNIDEPIVEGVQKL